MKIAILGNQARAMSNFWTVFIRLLAGAGHEVICIVPAGSGRSAETASGRGAGESGDGFWEEKLRSLGARIVHYPLDRKGLNPLKDMRTLWTLCRIFSLEKPDRLFAYTIKPVIYGSFASSLAGHPSRANRFLMITGLGYVFEGGTVIKRMLTKVGRMLYRAAFSRAGCVFFQNEDDLELFRKLAILPEGIRIAMSRGCGVDTDYFALSPIPEGPPVFLYVGRLIEAKGLRDIAEAACIIKAKYPDASFRLLGPPEYGPGAVPMEEVLSWQKERIVDYLGETGDVRPYLAESSVVLLPSWREGTPTSLMEAMSIGRALVAADAPGSREVVRHKVNGLLVPVRDATALANAVESFILEPELASRMGAEGRELACREFSAETVAKNLLHEMNIPL